jgi:CheY-like chemotaxis protein
MTMPGMGGLTLAREIRKHRGEHELPLPLITSLGRLQDARTASEFAVQLAKPLKASQLFNALITVLADRAKEPEAPPVAADGVKPATSALRVLLAEDNAVNQKVALRLLERLGYRADVAWDGLEALEALERQPYDVVLMDVQMPELDGLDVSRRICERWPPGLRPRIIAMTANVRPEDREACFSAGMDDYLSKPIRPDELARALRHVRPLPERAEASSDDAGVTLAAAALEKLRELGGDDFLGELIDTFLAEAPSLLATLRRALEQDEADEAQRAAHTLKSTARPSAPRTSRSSAVSSKRAPRTVGWKAPSSLWIESTRSARACRRLWRPYEPCPESVHSATGDFLPRTSKSPRKCRSSGGRSSAWRVD